MEKKVYLVILDGFGLGDHGPGNAVYQADAPFLKRLLTHFPLAKLRTHGTAVGLPEFQMGGSEVGHLTMGAGRPVKHLLTIINDDIESGEFFKKPILKSIFEKAKNKGRIHFVGLASDGGIHSFLPHLFGLQKMAQQFSISEVFIHAFLDGRDVPERTARQYLEQIEAQKTGKIATVGGRFFAMDRDKNWERTKQEYDVLCSDGVVPYEKGWRTYLEDFYSSGDRSDYYVPPVLLHKEGRIQTEDAVIFFNFRTDRMKQITEVFCQDGFSEFSRPVQLIPDNIGVFGNYNSQAHTVYSLSGKKITHTLGEVVAHYKKRQLRIAESEKFNHVTSFFSGERKEPFPGEERLFVPSPKCPSYATKPEMSALEHTSAAMEKIKNNAYSLVVHNYANGDLVGHSSDIKAAIQAVEVMDECLGKLIPFVREMGYEVFVTADHGNCEEMIYPDGTPSPAHSKNLVPFVAISDFVSKLREAGELSDVAPTILQLLGFPVPKEMTGTSLILE